MNLVFLFGLLIAGVGQLANGQRCGLGIGEDICGCKRQTQARRCPIVVRPVDLPKPVIQPIITTPAPLPPVPPAPPALPVPPLLPLGGPCSCKQTLVKPAIVPKPVCQCTQKVINQGNTHVFINQDSTGIVNAAVTGLVDEDSRYTGEMNGVGAIASIYGNGCRDRCYNDAGLIAVGDSTIMESHGPAVVETIVEGGSYVDGASGAVSYVDASSSNAASSYGYNSQYNEYTQYDPSTAPADAVSMSIAYNMAKKACQQGEDRLFFGFRQLPKELPRKVITRRIVGQRFPEEGNLYRLNGQVVELKVAPACTTPKSLAEEAAEELMDLIAEEQDEGGVEDEVPVRKLTLGEIGYAPAKVNNPTFVDVPAEVSEAIEEAVGAAGEAISDAIAAHSCQDGFQSGKVAVAPVPQRELMLSRPRLEPLLEPCSSEEDDRFAPIPLAVQYTSCAKSQSHQQSSSSSSFLSKLVSKLS